MLVVEKENSHMSISEMPAPSDSVLNSKWFGQKLNESDGSEQNMLMTLPKFAIDSKEINEAIHL
jgi:hypothetical protein